MKRKFWNFHIWPKGKTLVGSCHFNFLNNSDGVKLDSDPHARYWNVLGSLYWRSSNID